MGNLAFEILQWTLALAGVWLISGTLMNFSSHPHWYIRGWDFPRVLTAGLALIVAAAWAWICDWQWWDWVFLASLVGVVGVIRAADVDIILAVEFDDAWMERAVRPLMADWPHVGAEPRDNHYGMVL